MIRPSALLMLCLTLLLPMAAVARLDGPLEVTKPGKVRDLAQIRSSRTLRVWSIRAVTVPVRSRARPSVLNTIACAPSSNT